MLPNQINQKFELFNLCPFIVCISNKEGDLVFINTFASRFFKEVNGVSKLNVYNKVQELFPENYSKLNKIISDSLQNNKNASDTFSITYRNNSTLNISITIEHLEPNLFVQFYKFLPSTEDQFIQHISNSIIKNAANAIVGYTLEGRVVVWNLSAEKLFGYTSIYMLGQDITKYNFPIKIIEEGDVVLEAIKIEANKSVVSIQDCVTDTETISYQITTQAIYNVQKEVIGISKIFTNITPFIEKSKLVEKHIDNLKYLNDIWESISKNLDVQSILQIVTDVTTKFTGAAYGAFFYNSLTSEGEAMRLFTLSGAKREDFMKLGMPRNTAIFQKTFSSKEVFVVNDVTQHIDYGQNAPNKGIPEGHLAVKSYMSIPVISIAGENLGSLLFGHPEANKFSVDHIEMMQNIARQAAIALDNSRLLENIKNLSSKKDVFIAMAGHELRSPLTIIKGFVQILEEMNTDEDLEIYIEKVLEQVEKLNLLVDDLLDLSQIESGEINLNKTTFDLGDLINETIESLTYSQNTHKITFDSFLNTNINADRRRLQQVIYNIIYNGIKYSPKKDTIIVEANVENNEAIIKVIDFGIGISEKHMPNIFERFYRVESDENTIGFGIGLYLCSKIIQKHNGTIHVNSVLGEGSEFIFKIPLNI